MTSSASQLSPVPLHGEQCRIEPERHSGVIGELLPGAQLLSCREFSVGNRFSGVTYHGSLRSVRHNDAAYLIEHAAAAIGITSVTDVGIVQFPGLTESVNHDLVKGRAEGLANELRPSSVLALGSNAIGIPGEIDLQSREEFVAERFSALVEATPPNQRLLLVGTSMGGIIMSDVVDLNLRQGEPLNIAGQIYIAPAIRRTGGVKPGFALSFGRQIVQDGARDIALSGPLQLAKDVRFLRAWGLDSIRDLKNARHQITTILGDTHPDVIDEALDRYPTVVIAGTKDKVVDFDLWNTA
ncbi:alpha/beta hydrolase, partial [Candidatus Saccharibacteria bacterium]|nr:alpha/beta hydrolase [Candidatus Saccharibacteria bacterium]